jgi:branched-chain amino acid transport system substrate-binding protein
MSLLAAGCGKSGADNAGLSGQPVKIGLAVSESGPLASSVESTVGAAQAWAQLTNDEGGLGGRPVEIEVEDTKGDAGAAQAAVRKLVEDQDVVAMMLADAVAEGAVGQYLQDRNIPVIGVGGYAAPVWNQLSNFFTIAPNSATVISSLVSAASAAGAHNFSSAVCAESATCADDASKVYQPATAANGLQYSGYVTVNTSQANYTAECLGFRQQNADFIALLLSVDTNVRLMQDCMAQGGSAVFGTTSSSFNAKKYSAISGMHMVGTLNGFPWWANDPAVERYRSALGKYESKTNPASTSGTTTWAALELFKKAIGSNTATVSRDSVFSAYRSLKGETLGGLLPAPVTFTAGQPSPAVNCFWQYDYKAGDENPTLLAPKGTSGNGASGDLATACLAGTS